MVGSWSRRGCLPTALVPSWACWPRCWVSSYGGGWRRHYHVGLSGLRGLSSRCPSCRSGARWVPFPFGNGWRRRCLVGLSGLRGCLPAALPSVRALAGGGIDSQIVTMKSLFLGVTSTIVTDGRHHSRKPALAEALFGQVKGEHQCSCFSLFIGAPAARSA